MFQCLRFTPVGDSAGCALIEMRVVSEIDLRLDDAFKACDLVRSDVMFATFIAASELVASLSKLATTQPFLDPFDHRRTLRFIGCFRRMGQVSRFFSWLAGMN